MSEVPGRESSLTLQRGLALLQAVADSGAEAPSISELATAIGTSRAAVYRLLGPLAERGLIWRDGTKVRLGLGLLELAGKVFPQLRAAALPALRELAEELGATAHLSVADGTEVLAVAVVEPSWTSYHVAYRVGSRHSRQLGAAGRAIDSAAPWVCTTGELQHGASGVAAPLPGVPGSVGVVSMRHLEADEIGPRVVAAAAAVAAALHIPQA